MKIKKPGLAVCLLFLLSISTSAWAYTEIFYVCQGGNGSAPEDGTCANAWDAADFNSSRNWDTDNQNDGKIGPNDLVIILNDGGRITSSDPDGVLDIQQSGLSGKPITIQGEDGQMPVIDGQTTRVGIQLTEEDYITVRNLEVVNGTNSCVRGWDSHYIIIEDSKLHDSDGISYNGSVVFLNGTGNIVRRNEIYNSTQLEGCHGVYFGGTSSNSTAEYNYIHDNYISGIQCNGPGTMAGMVIRYNWFEDNGWVNLNDLAMSGGKVYGNIFVSTGTTNAAVIFSNDGSGIPNNVNFNNNTIYGNYSAYMIWVGQSGYATNIRASNNILHSTANGSEFVNIQGTSSSIGTWDRNQYYNASGYSSAWVWKGSGKNTLGNWQAASGEDANSQTGDPQLKHPGNGDMTLQLDSPCIDAGTDLGAGYKYALDPITKKEDWPYWVSIKQQGNPWDIGAYVYSTGSDDDTPPDPPSGIMILE